MVKVGDKVRSIRAYKDVFDNLQSFDIGETFEVMEVNPTDMSNFKYFIKILYLRTDRIQTWMIRNFQPGPEKYFEIMNRQKPETEIQFLDAIQENFKYG